MTKTETALVIWLNIVTLVTLSCLLPAQMCEDVHSTPLVNCIVNDGLINAMPNMQQMLLQFTTLVYIKWSTITILFTNNI